MLWLRSLPTGAPGLGWSLDAPSAGQAPPSGSVAAPPKTGHAFGRSLRYQRWAPQSICSCGWFRGRVGLARLLVHPSAAGIPLAGSCNPGAVRCRPLSSGRRVRRSAGSGAPRRAGAAAGITVGSDALCREFIRAHLSELPKRAAGTRRLRDRAATACVRCRPRNPSTSHRPR